MFFCRISGTTGVEILSGLHWYLKYYCEAHISWSKTGGTQLSLVPKPGSLPQIQESEMTITRPTPWSYYQNAVSSSCERQFHLQIVAYALTHICICIRFRNELFSATDSFAWWDWERWEKEIDWMALQGINLPLAFTGQEAIWQKVFQVIFISSF